MKMKQIIIQFGGTGDLFRKKLIPAYINLLKKGYDFHLIALGRRYTEASDFMNEVIPTVSEEFTSRVSYLHYDMKAEDCERGLIEEINSRITPDCDSELIYYIALQPTLYETAIKQIQRVNEGVHCSIHKKIVVEKPFGFNRESAGVYNNILTQVFDDKEIYRVDHYLGKEFMQNLLIMRFHNDIIRGIWNNHFIDNIQIIFDETLGVDQRLGFYEQIGVVRDTVQNHILQIITHLTMSEPSQFTPEEISHEKTRVLRAMKPVEDFSLCRYESLAKKQEGHKATPTYTALKFYVDTYEFAGVPIYVRTGKMQKEARSQIFVNFKNTMGRVMDDAGLSGNSVIITTNPEMTIDITLNMKVPNRKWETQPVRFNFDHAKTFRANTPEAYEQIVEKILQSDKSLFPFFEEISEAWRIITPTLSGNVVETYPDHTMPIAAQKLIEADGRSWNT